VRVLVAPDSFTGTLTAPQAASAIAEGWLRTSPADEVHCAPLSDGGPGFVSVLHASLGGQLIEVSVTGPMGTPVQAQLLMVDVDHTPMAYIESAQACGLHLVPAGERDPRRTTTAGVGELLVRAVELGARKIVLGLGGTGTNDAGAGCWHALGVTAVDDEGVDCTAALRQGGGALSRIRSVDLSPAIRALGGVEVVIASDVDNPLLGLRGATNGYARQKGADDQAVMELEGALESFVAAVGRRPDGKDPAVALGAGAAGGLGYGLMCLNASRVPGIATVLATVGLDRLISQADVVVTGEGSFDWQSLRGKVVSGVAGAALEQGRPCVVLAGQVQVGRREYSASGVTAAFSVVEHLTERGIDPQRAFDDPVGSLSSLAARAAQTWGS
jgi:glycerate kinase